MSNQPGHKLPIVKYYVKLEEKNLDKFLKTLCSAKIFRKVSKKTLKNYLERKIATHFNFDTNRAFLQASLFF